MIYTGNRALQYLSVPVYTIFKNLTIIVIAYGEVLWFGGHVGSLTLLSFGLMVLSSIIAAWADIQIASATVKGDRQQAANAFSTLNAGYMWMSLNVVCSALYALSMRKVIKRTNFNNWDGVLPVLLKVDSKISLIICLPQSCFTTTFWPLPSSSPHP